MVAESLRRILLVDDERDILQIARMALEGIGGFQVEACESGPEAIRRIEDFHPDLVLMDIMMPELDGIATFERLRGLGHAIPTIFLTAATAGRASHVPSPALGTIHKPFDPMSLAARVHDLWSRRPPQDTAGAPAAFLEAPLEAYARSLPTKMAEIEESWEAARTDSTGVAHLGAMERRLHNLVGSGGTYGFDEISRTARRSLQVLVLALRERRPLRPAERELVDQDLVELRRLCLAAAWRRGGSSQPDHLAIDPRQPTGPLGKVLVCLETGQLAEEWCRQIECAGFDVHHGTAPAPTDRLPAGVGAVVIDEARFANRADALEWIRSVKTDPDRAVSVVFLSEDESVRTRLAAVRAGVDLYLTKPVAVHAVTEFLHGIDASSAEPPYRILVVDDDVDLAQFLGRHLERAGMSVRTLSDPTAILDHCREFSPDLVLMDLYMPQCNGVELARVVRQIDELVSVPIVFLSAETDEERQLLAMAGGGDDFLTKPIRPASLMTAVRARVGRARTLRSFIARDGLTGLLNHTHIKDRLRAEAARVSRTEGMMAVAMIDVDHFKEVNDRHGHSAGDRVLRSLSLTLQRRIRRSDEAGRYGGEEFLVIFPDASNGDAAAVVDGIRRDFAELGHLGKEGPFHVTFSAGVAHFPAYPDAESLCEAADEALFRAKRAGRNRVQLA